MSDLTPARPVPIRDAFRSVGSAVAFAGSVLTSLVGYGILDQVQGDALTNLLGLIPGAVAAGTAVLMAFGVRASAEPKVTPAEDPRTDDGTPLVRRQVAEKRQVPPDTGRLPSHQR